MRTARALAIAALLACSAGCAQLRPMLAGSDDLADYRAFRVADDEGVRLARALAYLEKHPQGAWAADVRAIFDDEEPRYYERSQASRQAMLDYLTNLPRGPHAEQALSLLVAFDRHVEDEESDRLLAEAKRTEATLEKAQIARKRVGERILGGLAVLLDVSMYNARFDEVPKQVRGYFAGPAPSTWGARPPALEEDLFFLLPTRPQRASRLLTLHAELVVEDGLVRAAELRGDDMLVKWYEASRIVQLDSGKPEDRAEAFAVAIEVLKGATESTFPEARCDVPTRGERELLVRRCDGRVLRVIAGKNAGDEDVIQVRTLERSESSDRNHQVRTLERSESSDRNHQVSVESRK
jgi:hypothetical protein